MLLNFKVGGLKPHDPKQRNMKKQAKWGFWCVFVGCRRSEEKKGDWKKKRLWFALLLSL